ncbi:MAG: FAD-dependent oxidoreductase [Armatimonadetes bacterium]|nr:FAD-dependent oxidoreductase [Armatimonadota bacterium]
MARVQVVVAGGGPAGSMAAIAAARRGVDVILLEAQPLLGGIGTGGSVHVYYWGMEGGIQEELDERDAELGAQIAPEVRGWHYAARPSNLADMAEEAGVEVWLRTLVTGVVMEGNVVQGVVVDGQRGRGVILCEVVVDATGDADVAALAGADFNMGREGDELPMAYSLTPGVADSRCTVFHANFDAGWVDPTDPWDYARGFVDGRKFLWREQYTADNRLYFCSPNLGLRESRLIEGDRRLTLDDLFFGARFADTIGRCSSHYDNHARDYAAESRDARIFVDVLGNWKTALGCDVPYGALLPRGIEGLLVAGRCISMTHDAAQALRMMRDMHRIGEAAGLAAALAVSDGVPPRDIDVAELQALLVEAGLLAEDELAEAGREGRRPPRPVDELIAQLTTDDRAPAMWELYRMGEKAVPALTEALEGEDGERARWAALVLGALGEEAARDLLVTMVRERDDTTPAGVFVQPRYVSALICLGEMGGESVAELLAEVLEDESQFGGRWLHVLRALAELGDASAAPAIKAFLERVRSDENYWSPTSDVKKFSGWKLELAAAQALSALGDAEGEEIARSYLEDPRLPVRRYAAKVLGMR